MHLDERLAEAFIAEFLVEPYRCIPRSPGVDAAAVLGDAAASHRRRQWRDATLIVLALVALVTYFTPFVLWTLVAFALTATGTVWTRGALSRRRTAVMLAVAIVGVGVVAAAGILSLVFASAVYSFGGESLSGTAQAMSAAMVIGAMAMGAIPLVILVEELLTVSLVRRHFSRSRFKHYPDISDDGVASLRRIGRNRFWWSLGRTRDAEREGASNGEAEVVVFRGEDPFVGAGRFVNERSIVIPLKREDESDARPPQVSEHGLQAAVGRSVDALRRRSSLSPHARLETMRHDELMLVSAYDLLAHWPSAEAAFYMNGGLHAPPTSRAAVDDARLGAVAPREWARYYQCFQVEGWERDLTVSCYFTLGTDGHLLYLEWVTCALPPLPPWFRLIDDHRALRSRALRRALSDIVSFPASLWRRLLRLFRTFEALPSQEGELVPEKYGAATSLRELAAADSIDDYFHRVDVKRYIRLFDRSILEGVRDYLTEHGLQIADFDRIAGTVYNNSVTNNIGSINGSVLAVGDNNQVDGTASTGGTQKGSGS